MVDTTSTQPAETGAAVQASVARLLRWSSRRANRRVLFGPAADDVSPNDVWLLDAVEDNGPVRLSDLASWQGVDKSTITPQVRRLEQRGLLERRTSTSDRRSAMIALSDAGRSLQRHRARAGAALIEELLQDWSQQDRRVFTALLGRFTDRLQAHPVPPVPHNPPDVLDQRVQ
jgi:DNA-binding MarR family transcriptional regulator